MSVPAASLSPPKTEPLRLRIKVAYGLPAFAGAAMTVPILVHMTKFYTDVVLLPAGYLAMAIALARGFDAVTDPLFGWLSDRTKSRFGRRAPWIAAGALLCAITFWALFTPPLSMTPDAAVLWFGITFGAYFVFHTMMEIPYLGLGSELSLEYHERSSLFGWRSVFVVVGTIVASVLPGILGAISGSQDQRHIFAQQGSFYAVLLILLNIVLLLSVRERRDFAARPSNPLVPGVRRALRNRPFRIFLVTSIIYSIPSAIPALLMPYYVQYVLQPANPLKWIGLLLFIYLGSGFLFLPLWMGLARRYGKLAVWIVCGIIGFTGGGALYFAGPGDTGFAALVMFYVGTQYGAFMFLAPAMVADVIDYDELYTGKRREAQYNAFLVMVPKFVAIPGASIPIAILAASGYVPNRVQSEHVITTIKILYAALPAVFNALALFFIAQYPLTQKVHEAIRAGIDQHTRHENARDPLLGNDIPPPGRAGVSEATGWFLDHFSRAELTRILANGSRGLVLRVVLSLAGCAALSVGAFAVAASSVSQLTAEPGPVAVLAVVIGGFALSGAVFHLLRLRPARAFQAKPIPPDVLRIHLGEPARDASVPLLADETAAR